MALLLFPVLTDWVSGEFTPSQGLLEQQPPTPAKEYRAEVVWAALSCPLLLVDSFFFTASEDFSVQISSSGIQLWFSVLSCQPFSCDSGSDSIMRLSLGFTCLALK